MIAYRTSHFFNDVMARDGGPSRLFICSANWVARTPLYQAGP